MKEKWEYNGVEFKPGDRVKVVRFEQDYAPNGMGQGQRWENIWIGREDHDKGMDGAFGHEFEINHIDTHGAVFTDFVDHGYVAEFSAATFSYPLSVLEKIVPYSQSLH